MDVDEAIRLLRGGREGIREWNNLRKAGQAMPDLTAVDLGGARLAGAILTGAQLSNANLAGTDLSDADLEGAVLIFASLKGADLHDSRLCHAHLIAADLSLANLQNADLTHAHLIKARLTGAHCNQARLGHADLSQADLTGADLTSATLTEAVLVDATLMDVSLKSANIDGATIIGVKYNRRRLICRGIRADSCHGHALFKRDVQDQDWIETFRAQSRRHYALYLIWLITSDCGRSLFRVWGTAIALALAFGCVYHFFPGMINMSQSAHTGWTPFYYSFVTMTTLGFGDVTPATLGGEILATLEAVLGYLTLGLLVSILANKVARRS
jgi:uncharacterized protein YjbI with pentapeptide repeats